MAHNGIIRGELAYIPYYHDGLRVFDISDPNNPTQIWEYDTYIPSDHDSYKGAWGVYPYLPSGNIIVSDMQTGLYIIELSNETTTVIENNLIKNIYPNPVKNQFNITLKADKITIYNSLEKKVKEEKLNHNHNTIFREKLPNGLYFYNLITGSKNLESGIIIFN